MPWKYLALPDPLLEQIDVVRLNLSVAAGIPGLEGLDIEKYVRVVDEWTAKFRSVLPGMEQRFHATPHKWKNDVRFFRIGMLQGFLGHVIGLSYIEEQKQAETVQYLDPGHLFLHGLIETKQGTCGNMPALHVAICRRIGWPVSLACARSHYFSRYDDGKVIHNIESTSTHPGSFCSEDDAFYIEKYKLPKRAIACGSDLRRLTAREIIAAFLALRGRHYCDTKRLALADLDFALSRVLFPNHRRTYVSAMVPMIQRGADLFDPNEVGHPNSLFEDLVPQSGFNTFGGLAAGQLQTNNNNYAPGHLDMHVLSMRSSSHAVPNEKEPKQ